MGTLKDQKDLKDFLEKVDDVDSIIKGLTSSNPEEQAKAITRADEKITALDTPKRHSATEIGFDRTCINKDAFKYDDSPEPIFKDQCMTQDAFLASVEADSQKRAKARKERHRKANLIKEKGNIAFNNKNYTEAVQFYSDAMTIAKDLTPLYTNRATALLKLGRYEDAICDCDFALRIDMNWTKAYIFKAKALQNLNQFEKAAEEFQKVLNIDKSKSNLIEKYLSQLEKCKKQYFLELQTTESLKNEEQAFVNISKLIQTIKNKSNTQVNNSLMYYVGGFQILQKHLVDDESKTLFHTEGGFDVFAGKGIIAKCIRAKYNGGQILPHTVELVSAFISLCTIACSQMVENLEAFFEISDIIELVTSFLEWPEESVKQSTILFFYEASLLDITRSVLYVNIDCIKLSTALLASNVKKSVSNANAAAALCNFALDKKYCQLLKNNLNDNFMTSLYKCVKQIGNLNYEALRLKISFLIRLIDNQDMCQCLGQDTSFQKNCICSLENCIIGFKSGITNPNLMTELLHILNCIMKVWTCDENCKIIVDLLCPVLLKCKNDELLLPTLKIIALVFELKKTFLDEMFSNQGYSLIKQLFEYLNKDVSVKTFALKILCLAGQANTHYIRSYIKLDKNYKVLRSILLSDDGTSEINQGHAALFLGALSTIPKGIEPILKANAEGDVVRKLLVLCRESKIKQVSSNCAIALGKLAVCDNKFLIELRKHDGINILARLNMKDVIG